VLTFDTTADRLDPPASLRPFNTRSVPSLACSFNPQCDAAGRGGTARKEIARRFQALMVAISMVRLTVSVCTCGRKAHFQQWRNFSNSGETLRRAALEGVGICLAPGFLVRDDLDAGRLVRLLPEYRPVELSMNAVYPHRHHLSAKVRTFIDMLVHLSAEHQKLINPYS
jgi:DNA-binding transcriptional LysR family regulator